LMVF